MELASDVRRRLLARSVPRYTSYPTAPHFRSAVGPAAYADWLANMPARAPVSLYLHVPYCRKLCWYCACHTRVANTYDPIARTRDGLLHEIAGVRRHIGHRPAVTQIHWGGGTPTILRPRDFAQLQGAIGDAFEISDQTEIAIEIDPRQLSDGMVTELAAARVGRVSFGVQDFDPAVQAAINRVQPFSVTANAVERLRRGGVASVNIDLLYGLPRQTTRTLAETIRLALELAPDRIALFGYAHVPWMKTHQKLIHEGDLPGPETRWAQSQMAADLLTAAGYVALGIDHFARPEDSLARAASVGRLRRNFQGYTTDVAPYLIGFGASAIGSAPEGYVQNAADVKTWLDAVERDHLATARGLVLTDDDRMRRDVIERIMCHLAVDLDAMAAPYGHDAGVFADAFPALRELASEGIVKLEGPRVLLTNEARPFARIVAAAFDSYLGSGYGRHSVAV